MSVATATGAPNTLSQPAHNAQFLSTQLQSAGYFQLKDDEAMIITVDPGDAEYFVVPVTNDWTITNATTATSRPASTTVRPSRTRTAPTRSWCPKTIQAWPTGCPPAG